MRPPCLWLLLCVGVAWCADTYSPARHRQLAHDIYKELIEINSSYSTGQTTPAVEAMARRLRQAGFPDADIHIVGAAPHKQNLIARYHGTGAQRPILLLAH